MNTKTRKPDARQSPNFRGSHRLRIGRISVTGSCYFVTTKTKDKASVLLQPAAAGIVMRSIEWMRTEHRWQWLCYVIMPDHAHIVFTLKGDDTLPVLMKSFKNYTALRINQALKRQGTVWQDGYFDHRIRWEEKLEQVAFYCYRNPVLAGLALDGEDWPFWKCKPWLWRVVEKQYKELLAQEAEKRGWDPLAVGATSGRDHRPSGPEAPPTVGATSGRDTRPSGPEAPPTARLPRTTNPKP